MHGMKRRQAGLTLLEMVAAITILTLVLVTIGLALQSSGQTAREIRGNYAAQILAQQYVDQLVALDFGSDTDPDPSVAQLEEFFDGDDDPGDITVNQLTRWPSGDNGWVIPVLGLGGTLRFHADFDLDDNGEVGTADPGLLGGVLQTLGGLLGGSEPEATTDDQTAIEDLENSGSIIRIRVFFNDRRILSTNRALEAS